MACCKSHRTREATPMPLPPEMVVLLAAFAPLFSNRVWAHAQILAIGAILATGKRTVTSALRIMGLSHEAHFTNYHRVLNRAAWCPRAASRILLGLIVLTLVPADWPIVLVADDTVERAPRSQDQGQGLLPRCRSVLAEGGGPVLRTEVGRDDDPRPTPLEQAGQGAALPDRLGLARIGAAAAGAPDGDRLREADGPPGTPLVPPAACRAGARWRVRGREAGARLSPPWGDDDLSPATRCGVV